MPPPSRRCATEGAGKRLLCRNTWAFTNSIFESDGDLAGEQTAAGLKGGVSGQTEILSEASLFGPEVTRA
jgi:hypothetical protein